MGGIWGNRWHVTIWKVVYDIKRPGIERNPNLEIYCYEPKYQSLDDSVNMDDDANELELLLTAKAELGALKLKQNHLQKMFEEGTDGGTTGLKIFEKMAKDLHSAKVNDEINTTMARIAQLPSMHGIITVN